MKGIILHGGHGTRLRPLTHTGPKQLLPIANKPMSEYCLDSIKEAGIDEIAIIIGGVGSNKVKEYYGNGKKFGVNITYIEQDEPRGIAHAISLCKKFVNNEKFLVFLGDNIIQKPIIDFVENFKNSDYDATVLLCEVDNPSRFGIADIENKKMPDKSQIFERLAIIDSQIEELVLRELEVFNFKQKTEIVLLRYLNNDDFFLYDPEIAEMLKIVELHKNLINRVNKGLANIGKTVKLVFMDSNYYEQWLSVNDFEDSPDIRIFWGSEQIKNISKS